MLTLGFTTQYYTLWEVSEPFKKYGAGMVINGIFTGSYEMVQDCTYRQNLSKDYDAAIAKISAMGEYVIDLDLRGQHSFVRSIGQGGNDMPEYAFTFGQLMGQDIRTATDIWQLKRAMQQELGSRRRVYARRRLIELGELVRNTIGLQAGTEAWINPSHFRVIKERLNEQALGGHFYDDGKRISLVIKRIGGFGWESQYGFVYVEKYLTNDGKIVKYKGTSPLNITEEFTEVMATVEHGDYKGVPETRLKRMKVIASKPLQTA
jgi:hypothetical protein